MPEVKKQKTPPDQGGTRPVTSEDLQGMVQQALVNERNRFLGMLFNRFANIGPLYAASTEDVCRAMIASLITELSGTLHTAEMIDRLVEQRIQQLSDEQVIEKVRNS